jgi:hypothetical protein
VYLLGVARVVGVAAAVVVFSVAGTGGGGALMLLLSKRNLRHRSPLVVLYLRTDSVSVMFVLN